MQVTVDLPEEIVRALELQWPNLHRQALEAIVVEGYRTGALNENQVRGLLGFDSRFQVHAFEKPAGRPSRVRPRRPSRNTVFEAAIIARRASSFFALGQRESHNMLRRSGVPAHRHPHPHPGLLCQLRRP